MKITLNPNRHREGLLAQCVMGILVIVVGYVIICKILKLCDHVLPTKPPQTTNSPSQYQQQSAPPVTAAAYIVIGSEPPPQPDACDCGSTFCLTYGIQTNGQAVITSWYVPVMAEFSTVTNYGLSTNFNQSSWNTNSVPIYMLNGILTVGDGHYKCVIERSTNFVNWKPISTNRMPAGYLYEFTDGQAPRKQAVYRVVVGN